MLAYLEQVFGDSNRRRNAKYKFQYLHQTGDFNTFWAKFLRLSVKLDRSNATLISNLTNKLSVDVRLQFINGDEEPTDLFEYAEQCRRVYQGLKEIAHAEALEKSIEECVVAVATPVRKVSTIRTAKSSHQPVISKKDQLMKERRCFSCRKVGHQTMDCLNKQKPTSKLAVSRMVLKESNWKESRTKASRAEVPRVEEPPAEKPLIVLSSSLPGDFFAEEALVASCTLGNGNEIKITALLNTRATGYSFVDPAMARCICDELIIEPIRLSKPKAIRGFDGKRALDVTHAIYPTMTVQNHRETITPMLITKLGQHQIILGKPWMKKHGVILDMRNDQLSFWPGHCQHTKESHAKEPHEEPNTEEPHAEEPQPYDKKPRAEEPHAGMTILKRQSNELPELLPYLLPSTRGVSKIMNTSTQERRSTPQKNDPKTLDQKLKPNVKDETNLKNEKPSVERANNPLDLAFIGGAPFMHLAKKKAEIFAISMRDIKYQLNKETKPLTNLKTVVLSKYHEFLDVFSKEVSAILRPYGKYDHKIELLKDKELSDLGHSAL